MSRVLVWRKYLSLTVAASMLLVTACREVGEKQRGARVKAVIGASELHAEQDASLAQVVGRLSFDGGTCTAFVTGASEITTAAHCVQSPSDLGALQFKTAAGGASVVRVREVVTVDTVHDVTVLRVDAIFAHHMSWSDALSETVKVVGFSGDREELLASAPCTLEPSGEAGAMLTHFCDTEPGMSGAPLVGEDGRVLGVHIGHLGKVGKNVAADATRFALNANDLSNSIDREWGPRIELPEIKVEWPKEIRNAKFEPRHLACIYALNAGYGDTAVCGTCLTAAGVATAGVAAAACAIPCGMAVADLTAVIISCQ